MIHRICFIIAAGMIPWVLGSAIATDFAVQTRIFVGGDHSPASEHRILFSGSTAFDLSIGDDRFVTVYDGEGGKVILLDRQTEQQTIVTTEVLLQVTAQADTTVTEPDQRQRLGLDATVTEGESYEISFADTKYVTETITPPQPTMAVEYGRFADLALKMNLLRPTGPPPFARMKLNRHIAAQRKFPARSTLAMVGVGGLETYRSTNKIGELTDADEQEIAQIRSQLATFATVGWKEFPVP